MFFGIKRRPQALQLTEVILAISRDQYLKASMVSRQKESHLRVLDFFLAVKLLRGCIYPRDFGRSLINVKVGSTGKVVQSNFWDNMRRDANHFHVRLSLGPRSKDQQLLNFAVS